MLHLDDISGNSRTKKLWVNIVIKSVFIIMLKFRAERECDWPLHLDAVKQMMPYFYANGHVTYARYCFTFGQWRNYQLRSEVGS